MNELSERVFNDLTKRLAKINARNNYDLATLRARNIQLEKIVYAQQRSPLQHLRPDPSWSNRCTRIPFTITDAARYNKGNYPQLPSANTLRHRRFRQTRVHTMPSLTNRRKRVDGRNTFLPRSRMVFRLMIPRTYPDSKQNERYYPRLTKSYRTKRTG